MICDKNVQYLNEIEHSAAEFWQFSSLSASKFMKCNFCVGYGSQERTDRTVLYHAGGVGPSKTLRTLKDSEQIFFGFQYVDSFRNPLKSQIFHLFCPCKNHRRDGQTFRVKSIFRQITNTFTWHYMLIRFGRFKGDWCGKPRPNFGLCDSFKN